MAYDSMHGQRPLSPMMSSGPLSPLLIGRPRSPCDGTSVPYLSRVMVSTPKTVRPVVDLQMPRRYLNSPNKSLSSFVQEQNFEMDRRIKSINTHFSQDGDDDPKASATKGSAGQDAIDRGEARSVLEETLNKLVAGAAPREVVEVVEEVVTEKLTGATSVPKFTNVKEQNEWYLKKAKADIMKCKPNMGQGMAGAELTKMLPAAQVFEIDNFRRDNEGMSLLRARIDDRQRRLSSRKGLRSQSCSPDPKSTFVHTNKMEIGVLPETKRLIYKQKQHARRETVKSNYKVKQSEKVEWHRELMASVAYKTQHAEQVIEKRKQDAIKDRTRIKSTKLLNVCTAAVRIGLMASILPRARRMRRSIMKKAGAANTILKFYRIYFGLIHFRRYKACLAMLAKRFKLWLPMWRMKRQMRIASTIVKFTQGLSGAGGTAAAIKAYKSKMTGLQSAIRKYLQWKHKQLGIWLKAYEERRINLEESWHAARSEIFAAGIKEGHHVEVDNSGDPVSLKLPRVENIAVEVSIEQLINLFTARREGQRERIKLWQVAMKKFTSECRLRMRMRIVQKNIQGDKFDIEKLLAEEEAKGLPPLVCPPRPEFNSVVEEKTYDEMIAQGCRVMDAQEDMSVSESAKMIARVYFKAVLTKAQTHSSLNLEEMVEAKPAEVEETKSQFAQ